MLALARKLGLGIAAASLTSHKTKGASGKLAPRMCGLRAVKLLHFGFAAGDGVIEERFHHLVDLAGNLSLLLAELALLLA